MEEQPCVENNRIESNDRSEYSDANVPLDFSRANIITNENRIRLVDHDDETGVDLFCYNSCSNDDSEFIKQCRGLVFKDDQLIMKAFSYTDELSHTDIEKFSPIFTDFKHWSFYTAYEGALLRLFNYSDKWFLSTHRKLNAYKSKWSSKESFGALFEKAIENEIKINQKFKNFIDNDTNLSILTRFTNVLDKTKQYMFLLRNNSDNRIVCSPPSSEETQIIHVGTFVNGVCTMDENVGLNYPEKHNFTEVKDLISYIENEINPEKLQGIMCMSSQKQLKVLHESYYEMFRVRGNEPSIKFRYLQVRMNKKLTQMLYHLYPNQTKNFDEYEAIIYEIARNIYKAYIQRFIKKHHVTVPREEYQVVTQCHSWHLSDRQKNRISLDKIIQVLNKQPPTYINHMIRRFKLEQQKKENVVPRTVPGSTVNSPQTNPVNTNNSMANLSL